MHVQSAFCTENQSLHAREIFLTAIARALIRPDAKVNAMKRRDVENERNDNSHVAAEMFAL